MTKILVVKVRYKFRF